jgi:hypothetical protein
MDRRLAAIAGAILAGAGVAGMLARRHGPAPADDRPPLPEPTDVVPAGTERQDEGGHAVPTGRTPLGIAFPVAMAEAGAAGSEGATTAEAGTCVLETRPALPLGEVLAEVVSGYPLPADRMLDLRIALGRTADAIEAETLAEGTVVVRFDWSPAPGLFVEMAVSVLATREYARVNLCDAQGNLRAPELDVYVREGEVSVVPDATARTVDLEERVSEATVTSLKLRALADGVRIHPGDAASVLRRCRIVPVRASS